MPGPKDNSLKKTLTGILDQAVSQGVCSGAQAAWSGPDGRTSVIWSGSTRWVDGNRVTPDTLFDIASLTKLFTASCILRMVDRGAIDLNSRVSELGEGVLPVPFPNGADLSQILAHEAGLVAWAPFFERIDPTARGTAEARRKILRMALETEPARGPGEAAEYSDLGYIILGELIGALEGRALDEIVRAELVEPLDLPSLGFRPVGMAPDDEGVFASTENCPWRGRVLCGEVHDDNAWAMGGVAGHAGLFGHAADVARFGAAWLRALEEPGWLSPDLAREAMTRRALTRGLGWDMKSPSGSSAGSVASSSSVGHLGFTGCSLWVDPKARVSVALLTNRVHPSRNNLAIRELRPAFHDALFSSFRG